MKRLIRTMVMGCVLLLHTNILAQPNVPAGGVLDELINPAACRQIVETLAADSFKGRFTGTPEGEKAAAWIAGALREAGCVPAPKANGLLVPFSFRWLDSTTQSSNVIGVLPGTAKSSELVFFSAHYDHMGTRRTNWASRFLGERGRPEKGDTIYNGANDNASGISALITLARYFAATGPHERTLVFIAFGGEEEGLLGSRALSVHTDPAPIVAMINMDMLGVALSKRNRNPMITGVDMSDLPAILNKQLYETAPELFGRQYFQRDIFPTENLFARSDNYWFARKGVPAHTIIATSPRHRYYHSLNDEPKTLDFDLLAKNIKAIALACAGLADGSDTPERIDRNRVE